MLRNGHRHISRRKYSSKTTTVVDQAKLFDKISSNVQHSRTLMYIYRNRWGLKIGRRWGITNYTNLTYFFNKSVLRTKLTQEIMVTGTFFVVLFGQPNQSKQPRLKKTKFFNLNNVFTTKMIIRKNWGILFLDKGVPDLWNLTDYGRSCLFI